MQPTKTEHDFWIKGRQKQETMRNLQQNFTQYQNSTLELLARIEG